MLFEQIKTEVKTTGFEVVRTETDKYLEAVLIQANLPQLVSALDRTLGKHSWPSENKLPAQAEETIKEFGGISRGQTLYFAKDGSQIFFAMLWPWQDNSHITLKMGVK